MTVLSNNDIEGIGREEDGQVQPLEGAIVAPGEPIVTREALQTVVKPLIEGKEKTYWRDIVAQITLLKQLLREDPCYSGLSELRELIHKKELGKSDFVFEHESVKLNINSGDSDDSIIGKLVKFIKEMKVLHQDDFDTKIKVREAVGDNKDRGRVWNTITAGLIAIKKQFSGTTTSSQVAELLDLIDQNMLGLVVPFAINTEKAVNLNIQRGESLDSILIKLLRFVSDFQALHKDKFDTIIDFDQAMEEIEAEKKYWTDILAALDNVQSIFPVSLYPGLQAMKEMIENNELGVAQSLVLDIGPVHLIIDKKDSDKLMKRKILFFVGQLKQLASEEEEQKLDDIYWRDIEAQLKAMRGHYGDNIDYNMLIDCIETGILGVERSVYIDVDGAILDVYPADSDRKLREKLKDFINKLSRQVNIDEEIEKKVKERIKQIEENAIKKEEEFREKIKQKEIEISQFQAQVTQEAAEIKQLKDEVRQLRGTTSPSSRSTRVSWPSYISQSG
ncbi:MAG: hypothetical protein UR28_C0014G0003 [Candidatus Peregrinibacteria bacterium GW2011_GWF2_33_10]|nr:MAG: hypothetical protein UR28_C0014G0003 [Candidatus Peregrinibacteria bacterium GW2011_GWF2_33_10]OGJ45147.1 MAG: hypothetical protein A2263_05345 [Candidatus Peregrinibacteria bacterium RIFOXYA2_FULL_33_21]OGJ46295.1 MAG: hypothetical protein A2272_03375 [Candidatus Peregrinibacteria bacterium RIFOXYA12_FULL_33_12]OGJ50816.1 MAG: hypothetical protein A2307_02115 [Candidatus Peregrinibacteria bacterium RIFOXYB2_FULL_33_20]